MLKNQNELKIVKRRKTSYIFFEISANLPRNFVKTRIFEKEEFKKDKWSTKQVGFLVEIPTVCVEKLPQKGTNVWQFIDFLY